ncbi:J domain-containing protein [Sandarakinorhabdus rubra]|uniref:J domain-containing protein n=1 Tax=Sandarakinorhabdus rubra TaxID=2672568 RepID=UPI0013DA3D13|nr:DnaJ family molecular chaperone [Sandarakinorhabdus rubra]
MGIWATLAGTAIGLVIGGPLGALAGAAAGGAVDAVRNARPERVLERRRVAFTIAAIALAAKMARADGEATAAEFATFQRLFHVEPGEAANARRFYDLAQSNMAGFEAYARQAASLLGPGSPTLEDLLDALWLIAAVDGFTPAELEYLEQVASLLGFDAAAQARIRRRHLSPAADDPWAILGVDPGADAATIRAAYHALVKRYHPDRALAEGVPAEFIRTAETRMADINTAYDRLSGRRP